MTYEELKELANRAEAEGKLFTAAKYWGEASDAAFEAGDIKGADRCAKYEAKCSHDARYGATEF